MGGRRRRRDLCCCWREEIFGRPPFAKVKDNSPETDKGEAEAQQQPLVGQGHGVVHLAAFARSPKGRRGLQRNAHGAGILDFDEVGEAADVFDQDGDDADAADEPAEEHWWLS